jgi:hypothetical protein
MRRLSAVILLAFAFQAYGKDLVASRLDEAQGFTNVLFNKMVDRMFDRFLEQELDSSESATPQHASLDDSTMGKAGTMAVSRPIGAAATTVPRTQGCIRYACSIPYPGRQNMNKIMRNVQGNAAAGDTFPNVDVDFGFPPMKVNMKDRLAGKKTIVVGLPGAFTPV